MGKLFSFLGNTLALVTGLGLLARYVPPQTFWPPTIIALLLPALLLGTTIFAAIQAYRRKWASMVFPVLIVALATPTLGRLFAWPDGNAASLQSAARLTVVTNNVRVFRDGEWETVDSASVLKAIRSFEPDVLMLQEVRNTRWAKNYIETINSVDSLYQRHQPQGKTVATYAQRVDPITSSFESISGYNGYLVTDITTELGKIRFINAHLQSNQISGLAGDINKDTTLETRIHRFGNMLSGYGNTSTVRAIQAEAIRKVIDESPYPVILGGDFNDVPSSYTYNRILTPRLRDAWAVRGTGMGTTFTGPLPGLRIDYLLVDTSLQVLTVERLPARWSDHRPLRVVVGR